MDYHHPFDDPVDHLQFFASAASAFASPTKKAPAVQCVVVDCVQGGAFSCPHCGLSYCNRHAGSPLMVAKMAGESGAFDPVTGDPKRVCVYCYWEKRPGYCAEEVGELTVCDHMAAFANKRTEAVDRLELAISRVERRLQKLSEYRTEGSGLAIGAVGFREYCQRVIPWDADETADKCPLCASAFSPVFSRKHHCRLCGGLVCAACSRLIPLRVLVWSDDGQVPTGAHTIDTRACSRCHDLLFKYTLSLTRRARTLRPTGKSDLAGLFSKYSSLKSTIQGLLPRYNHLLLLLEDAKNDPTVSEDKIREHHEEATACRDALMLQFVHFEATAKKMRACQCHELLCRNVLIAAQQFLHKHMFTLQLLPKYNDIVKARSGQVGTTFPVAQEGETTTTTKWPGSDQQLRRSVDSDEPVVANTAALQDKLDALQVQQEQLRGFLSSAINAGQAEEAALLQRAIGECKDEARKLKLVMHK